MTRAGAVWVDVLPSMAGWNSAVRTQAAVSLEGTGLAAGKGFTGGLMRAVRGAPLASAVTAQAKVAADKAAMSVQSASAKVTAARKREADAAGAVRVAELKVAEVRGKENVAASTLAAAEERLAKAQRVQAAATDTATAAAAALVRAEEAATTATAALGTESLTTTGRFGAMRTSVTSGADRMTSKLGGFVKGAAAMGGLFAGFEAVKFAGQSLHAAMDFQKGTQILQTAAGELPQNLALVRNGLMAISSETGTSLDQMTEGMYIVEKAGIRGALGLDVMRAAAKGAKDEGADLGIVTNALTTIMLTSGGAITNPSKAMNALMVAAGHSKTTLQEFAGSLSSVLPLASKVKIPFQQIAGAISTMTAQGMSAQQTTQDLNHVIASLATPTRMMSYEMNLFGINSANVRDKLGKRGLQGTIEFLSEAIQSKLGPSAKTALDSLKHLPADAQTIAKEYQQGLLTTSQFEKAAGKQATPAIAKALLAAGPAMRGYTQALSKMTGGQMGLTTSLMLTGKNADLFKKSTEDVGKAVNSTADFDMKWGITSKTTSNALSIAKQSIDNVGTALATQLLPSIAHVATGFADGTMAVSKFTSQNWSWLKPIVEGLGLLVGVLVAVKVATLLSTAATTLYSVAQGGLTLATVAGTVATGDLAGAMGILSLAMDANPIGVVAAALVGVAAAAYAAYKIFDQGNSSLHASAQQVQSLADTYDHLSGAITTATKVSINADLSKGGANSAMANAGALGITGRTLVGASLGNVADINAVKKSLIQAQSEVQAFYRAGDRQRASVRIGEINAVKAALGFETALAKQASQTERVVHFNTELMATDFKGIAKPVALKILAGSLLNTTQDVATLALKYKLLPSQIKTVISAEQVPTTLAQVQAVISAVEFLSNKSWPLHFTVSQLVALPSLGKPRLTPGHNAAGTNYWRGGPTWVNENGPELINLPRGSQVIPAARTAQLLSGRTAAPSLNGQRLRLVLANGKELDAHIEQVADSRVTSAAQLRGETERAFGG